MCTSFSICMKMEQFFLHLIAGIIKNTESTDKMHISKKKASDIFSINWSDFPKCMFENLSMAQQVKVL